MKNKKKMVMLILVISFVMGIGNNSELPVRKAQAANTYYIAGTSGSFKMIYQ